MLTHKKYIICLQFKSTQSGVRTLCTDGVKIQTWAARPQQSQEEIVWAVLAARVSKWWTGGRQQEGNRSIIWLWVTRMSHSNSFVLKLFYKKTKKTKHNKTEGSASAQRRINVGLREDKVNTGGAAGWVEMKEMKSRTWMIAHLVSYFERILNCKTEDDLKMSRTFWTSHVVRPGLEETVGLCLCRSCSVTKRSSHQSGVSLWFVYTCLDFNLCSTETVTSGRLNVFSLNHRGQKNDVYAFRSRSF